MHHLDANIKQIVRGWSLMTVFGTLVMEMTGNIGYFDLREALLVILAVTSSSTTTNGGRTALLRNLILMCTVQRVGAISCLEQVQREGAPPSEADHPAQPAPAEVVEPPSAAPGMPHSFQPAPSLGSEEIDNLRAALAPESVPPPTGDVEIEEVVAATPGRQDRSPVRRDSTVTVQEPEAERSRAPSVDVAESRQGRFDRPDTSDEPPAQRPRLDMLAGSGGPDRLDGHRPGPSSSTRWDPSPRGGWVSRPDSALAHSLKTPKTRVERWVQRPPPSVDSEKTTSTT
jgi:hypothetical protein